LSASCRINIILYAPAAPLNPLSLYFVDNVITTGNSIRAARAVFGWGTGLAYADASTLFNNRLTQPSRNWN
jgi:hypothetical protein